MAQASAEMTGGGRHKALPTPFLGGHSTPKSRRLIACFVSLLRHALPGHAGWSRRRLNASGKAGRLCGIRPLGACPSLRGHAPRPATPFRDLPSWTRWIDMDRRRFIQTTCAAAGALKCSSLTASAQATAPLEKAFRNPPEDAGLSIVYHWTGGAVTREGITADMEGIAASGIKVVNWFYFDGAGPTNAEGIPTPACLTPEWWGYVEHLMSEARRLNLIVAPHVCSSWGPAGSAAITPELSQQQLVWSERDVQGGQPFTGVLAKPERPAAAGRGGGDAPAQPTGGGPRKCSGRSASGGCGRCSPRRGGGRPDCARGARPVRRGPWRSDVPAHLAQLLPRPRRARVSGPERVGRDQRHAEGQRHNQSARHATSPGPRIPTTTSASSRRTRRAGSSSRLTRRSRSAPSR